MRSFFSYALVAIVATASVHVVVPSDARAQESTDEQARRHFRLGQAHYDNGSFLEAAREFEQAYQLSQRPQLLYNVYVAYRDAGDLVRSRDALREYLARVPDAENASMLRARLESLERIVAQSQASGTSETTTTGSSETTTSTETTTASSSSSETTSSSETASGEATGSSSSSSSSSSETTASSGGGGISPAPIIVAGVGAAMMIGGAITGALAMSSQDTLQSTCPDRACPPGYDYESEASNGRTLAITTDVLLFGGGAVLVGGVVWLVVDLVSQGSGGDESSAPPVTATCGPEGCAIATHFVF